MEAITELQGVTEVCCHTIVLAARHKRAHPALTRAGEGWYSIYLPR